jgi:hypothetical protein
MSRDVPSKWAQNNLLRKIVDRGFADSWRNLARPITFSELEGNPVSRTGRGCVPPVYFAPALSAQAA